jgi:hypothetical protein
MSFKISLSVPGAFRRLVSRVAATGLGSPSAAFASAMISDAAMPTSGGKAANTERSAAIDSLAFMGARYIL